MKIASVKAIAHSAPTPDMRGNGRNYVYVKVTTDDGLVGWGESSCGSLSVVTMIEELGAMLIGQDAGHIELAWHRMFNCSHNLRGGIIHMAALSGIDIALWDIKGKRLNAPLHDLLGGKLRDSLWCYGRFDGPSPDQAIAHALRETGRGFTALKGDPFISGGPEHHKAAIDAAARIVHEVRQAVGPDVELLVEAHGRLTADGALRFLDAVHDDRIYLIEEPLVPEDLKGLERLRARTDVMLAAGERLLGKWSFLPLLQSGLVDIIQPDPAHAGGVTELRKIMALAEAHHVFVQPHNPYGPINTLVATHLNAVSPNFLVMEVIMEEEMHGWFDEAVGAPFAKPRGGTFGVPSGAGIGHAIDEEAVSRYPTRREAFPSSYLRTIGVPSRQYVDWR